MGGDRERIWDWEILSDMVKRNKICNDNVSLNIPKLWMHILKIIIWKLLYSFYIFTTFLYYSALGCALRFFIYFVSLLHLSVMHLFASLYNVCSHCMSHYLFDFLFIRYHLVDDLFAFSASKSFEILFHILWDRWFHWIYFLACDYLKQ